MKSDLDRLMKQRGLEAIVVVGPDGLGAVNAPFRYFVGDAHLTGLVIKRRGRPPALIHHDMERDAAESTGLEPFSTSRWPLKEIFDSCPNLLEARVELYRRIFRDLDVSGPVALAGVQDAGEAVAFWARLREALPELVIVRETDATVLEEARMTKDAGELRALEQMGGEACRIVEEVRLLLSASVAVEGALADDAGPLTIGGIKRLVRERMHRRGLEAGGDFIFAANADAAVPHNVGDPSHVLAPGDVVLFDFFPRGRHGYFHDVTRTWSIGPARDEVQSAFRDVLACFEHVLELTRPGSSTRELQLQACAFFESRGHATMRQDPSGRSGYVHALGHGLGLEVHERPSFPSFRSGGDTRLEPGMVLTLEPGLYYPEQGFGIRIEDTVVVTEVGARSLSPAPKELELPLASAAARVGS